jgi:flavin reductase (DIM6/NTAB) family NADH-FMN oxidoreductase RutF
MNGYEYVPDKFGRAGLTPLNLCLEEPARIEECPAQMEIELVGVYEMMQDAECRY